MKNSILSALIISILSISNFAYAQVGRAWAWDSGKIKSNGSVSIQANNGSANYNAISNPTGAVAKINQSAVTQPPTVIIQATSGSGSATVPSVETVAVSSTSAVLPACPAGFTLIWSKSGNGVSVANYSNIAGTKFHFGYINNGGSPYYVIAPEGAPQLNMVGGSGNWGYVLGSVYSYSAWSIGLCSK